MKDSILLFHITKISTLSVALSILLSGCSSINLPKINQKPAPVVTSTVSIPSPVSPARKSPAQDMQPAKTKPSPSDLLVAEGAGGVLKAMNILHANEKNRLGSDNVGYYMDVLFASLQQKLAGINILASRREQDIKITIPGSLIFDSNSAQLNTFSQQPLLLISDVLTEYYKTLVIVEGHADSQGDAKYNFKSF